MATDKELLRKRFESSFGKYHKLATVQYAICTELADMLPIGLEPSRILEIGVGTGFLTNRLIQRFPFAEFTLNDISPVSAIYMDKLSEGKFFSYIWEDAETMAFPEQTDLIASASTIQWFDNLPGFIKKCRAALKSNGWLLLSTFGPENFKEIKATTGEGLNYSTAEQLSNILENNGFKIKNIQQSTQQLWFATPSDVLHHIKATGVNSIRQTRWNRADLNNFSQSYRSLYSVDGKVPLTYHPIKILAQNYSHNPSND